MNQHIRDLLGPITALNGLLPPLYNYYDTPVDVVALRGWMATHLNELRVGGVTPEKNRQKQLHATRQASPHLTTI